jgi:hypothetical protein
MRVFLLVGLALALAIGPATATGGQPVSLRITKIAPLTVRGAGFTPGERVRLVATTGRGMNRTTAVASVRGAFAARFSMLFAVEPCHGTLTVAAIRPGRARVAVTRPCRPGDPQVPFIG